ncbi:hypothetical protein Bca101_099059 [Brassica carinata]
MGDKGFTASELESRDNRNTSVDNFPFQDSTVGEDTMILSILFLLLKSRVPPWINPLAVDEPADFTGGFSLSPKAQYPLWCPDEAG